MKFLDELVDKTNTSHLELLARLMDLTIRGEAAGLEGPLLDAMRKLCYDFGCREGEMPSEEALDPVR
jgi:hypothetical protein